MSTPCFYRSSEKIVTLKDVKIFSTLSCVTFFSSGWGVGHVVLAIVPWSDRRNASSNADLAVSRVSEDGGALKGFLMGLRSWML